MGRRWKNIRVVSREREKKKIKKLKINRRKQGEFVRIEKYDTMLSEDDGIENYTALDMIFPSSSLSSATEISYRGGGGEKNNEYPKKPHPPKTYRGCNEQSAFRKLSYHRARLFPLPPSLAFFFYLQFFNHENRKSRAWNIFDAVEGNRWFRWPYCYT